MTTEQLQTMIQETIAKLSEYKVQEEAIAKQSNAITNKTYDSVLIDFKNSAFPDAKMVFITYINGVKHTFPFVEQSSKDSFYASLASFLQDLQATVNAQKGELKTKLNDLNNAL